MINENFCYFFKDGYSNEITRGGFNKEKDMPVSRYGYERDEEIRC